MSAQTGFVSPGLGAQTQLGRNAPQMQMMSQRVGCGQGRGACLLSLKMDGRVPASQKKMLLNPPTALTRGGVLKICTEGAVQARQGQQVVLAAGASASGEAASGEADVSKADTDRRGHGQGFRNGFIGALTDTEFDRAIFALAIPALGSLIIEPVVRTLEAVMVGRLGAAPLGALSIGGSVVSVSFPLFNFFSYATTPLVARALAREDQKEASRLVAQGIWLSTIVGCSLGIDPTLTLDCVLPRARFSRNPA